MKKKNRRRWRKEIKRHKWLKMNIGRENKMISSRSKENRM